MTAPCRLPGLLVLGTLCLASCSWSGGDQTSDALDGETARRALIIMVEGAEGFPDEALRHILTDLKTKAIEADGPERVRIGGVPCNLEEKRFTITLENERAIRHKLIFWKGQFERASDGRWQAVITERSWTH